MSARVLYEADFIGPMGPRDARLPPKPGAFVARTGSYTRFVHVWNGSLRLMSYVSFSDVSTWIGASYLPVDGSRTVDELMAQTEEAYLARTRDDLCPLCGEDRTHPSQHGKHAC